MIRLNRRNRPNAASSIETVALFAVRGLVIVMNRTLCSRQRNQSFSDWLQVLCVTISAMTVTATSTSTARQRWLKAALGRPADWHLTTPHISAPRPRLSWLGPILIAISALVAWPAFAGATGEDGSVQLGLFVGAVSIVLMAWSFLLAVRVRWLEPLFGGLDSMYRVHRWAGTLAVVAMWLHTSVEAEIEGGIRGASRSVANSAEDLAGTGQTMLYILVGISLIRWFPYRWWRLTHKLLGIPFAFACWHFYTAEKTYANGSPWGIYFATIMVVGLASYVLRVVGKDAIAQGLKYRIVSHTRSGSTSCIDMEPVGRPMKRRAGQFVTFKIQRPGLREPHSFTVASSPTSELLRFYIRDLGDWTAKIQTADLIGAEVLVEGPFGTFEPLPHHRAGTPVLWVAGGVGITPFLSAIDGLPIGVTDHGPKPVVVLLRPAPRRCIGHRHARCSPRRWASRTSCRRELAGSAVQRGNAARSFRAQRSGGCPCCVVRTVRADRRGRPGGSIAGCFRGRGRSVRYPFGVRSRPEPRVRRIGDTAASVVASVPSSARRPPWPKH